MQNIFKVYFSKIFMGKNLEKISEIFHFAVAGAFFTSVLTPLTLGVYNFVSENKMDLDSATIYGALIGVAIGAGAGFFSKYRRNT